MKKKPVIVIGVIVAIVATISLCLFIASKVFVLALGLEVSVNPFTIIQYAQAYPDNKQVMKFVKLGALAGVLLPVLLVVVVSVLMKRKQSLFGEAKLANVKEILKAGLLPKLNDIGNGLLIGKIKRGLVFVYMLFKGAQFGMVVAPTRSGKGVSCVIPNLLTYPNSCVVLDIKQENWELTSKYRADKLKNECFLFNPMATDFRTHRYNPLDYISKNPIFRVHDVQKIGQMLYPAPQEGDDIWSSTSRSLFNGLVLMLIETGQPVNLGNVLDQVSKGDGQKYLQDIINKREGMGKPLSDFCVRALNEYVSMSSENTRSGVIGNFRTSLQLWNNPLVRASTETSDFSFEDLRKKKMSIYVGVTPNNLEDLRPLLNLFFQQLIDINLKELPEQNPDIKHDVLLLMDEFTALGKIPVLMKGVAYIAGYGLRLLPIIQNVDQLRSVYGDRDANNFIQNIACYIVFPPSKKDVESAKQLSESLGYITVKSRSTDLKKRTQGSESDHQRALFLPQEITSLGQDKSIVIIDNMNPIIAKKIKYYEEEFFLKKFAEISGKKVSGFDIKNLAQTGAYSAHVPLLEMAKDFQEEHKEDGINLGKNLQKFLYNIDSILNGFKLKELLIKKSEMIAVDREDENSIFSHIDDLINTALYSNIDKGLDNVR